jgi:hypothetical protein
MILLTLSCLWGCGTLMVRYNPHPAITHIGDVEVDFEVLRHYGSKASNSPFFYEDSWWTEGSWAGDSVFLLRVYFNRQDTSGQIVGGYTAKRATMRLSGGETVVELPVRSDTVWYASRRPYESTWHHGITFGPFQFHTRFPDSLIFDVELAWTMPGSSETATRKYLIVAEKDTKRGGSAFYLEDRGW